MLLFFYGEDSYRSRHKLIELKQKHIAASGGDMNFVHLYASQIDPATLKSQLLAFPFLAKTRLVIIEDLISGGSKTLQDELIDTIDQLPETTVAVIYESGVPDRRTITFKTLAKASRVQEFKKLDDLKIESWIVEKLDGLDLKIDRDAKNELIKRCEGDGWRLESEIQKIATYLKEEPKKTITLELVELLVKHLSDDNVFALTDALAKKDFGTILNTLDNLADSGENPQFLMAMAASSLRTETLIEDARDKGFNRSDEIAVQTGLKSFVIGKYLQLKKDSSSLEEISNRWHLLAALDSASKSGILDADLALDLFGATKNNQIPGMINTLESY